ncbi:carboxypeptidase-like regulatory domain-containing protein [uncultured Duncaniella sp.]|uniref:carboxypeptidase-like regulatory domain-containing protein n=1 Tax=uncultured Duncaniella sp. TaxID=2768039 RepID=UPI0025B67CDB|nr:carboxypeptidase-like regulatory domain-containing protein [uncultured Duncaniella sp.]
MNRYSFFILCFLLGLLSASAADPDGLRGRVVDADTDEPVVGCIVKSKGAFTSTDKEGCFVINPKEGADSVSFRFMGYESASLPITADFSCVRLRPKATQLNDVIVEAPDIYAKGDTLVFNVAKYANAKDNAIIDVIKRLPGIKVEEDGTIKYQGKPINKFYLDGNDFIGGQYGLATNNISYKDVASVEVMENHQPVKALEGIEFPEEAGINLKLKEDARSRWVGVAQATAGVQPLLYNGSLYTMRIGPKTQNIITLKADNTGWNPANEIQEHDFDDMFSSDYISNLWPEYISADIVNAPLTEKRTRDNLSWLANAITAWKKGDTSMRLNLNYMGDRLGYNSGVTTDYFSNQIPQFVQNNSQRTQTHDLSAQFYSQTNKRGYFLKEKFSVTGLWDKSNSAITGSSDLAQRVDRKSFSANNDLKLVKRNEKKLFTLISRNTFVYRPDRLLVVGDEDAVQSIGTTDFRSTTETKFGKMTRFWKYYVSGGLDLDWHRINSTLSGLGDFDNDGIHEAFLSNLYATPQVDYERNGWRASLTMPLKWLHYSVSGQHDYINASPRLYVKRQLTAKSDISGSVTYSLGSPQPYLNITAPVLSDYRNLFIADNPDKYSQNVAATLSYRYRNPLKSMFFNLSATYNHSRSSIMSNQLFIDDFIISTYADRLSDSNSWYVKGGFSKGLGHSKMVVGCDVDASTASASSMRDNAMIPYHQIAAGVKPYFKGSLTKWLSANYEASYGFSKLKIDGEANDYHTFRQNIFTTIIPNDIVQFTVGAEHFLTRFPEGNTANLVLLDASAVWRLNNKVRLSLIANNVLNRRSYEYVNYGTLSRSEHHFRIRPRSILASIQYRF